MGRPNLGYQERLEIKHSAEQRRAYERAAAIEGVGITEWARRVLDHASGLAERRIQRVAQRTIPIVYQHRDKTRTIIGPRGGVRRTK